MDMEATKQQILFLVAGLVFIIEVTLAYLLHKKYRHAIFTSFFYYLLFANVFAFYGFWNQHALTLLSNSSIEDIPAPIFFIVRFTALPLLMLGNYFFIKFFRTLVGRVLSLKFTLLFFSFEIFLFFASALILYALRDLAAISYGTLQRALEYLYILNDGICIILALSQYFIYKPPKGRAQKIARNMTFYYLAIAPVYLFLLCQENVPLLAMFHMMLFPIYDLIPLLWLFHITREGSFFVERPSPDCQLEAFVRAYQITPREKQIIELIAQGKSNQEISSHLYVSLQTVKDHNHHIFQKTGVKSRMQLIHLLTRHAANGDGPQSTAVIK